MNGSATHSMYYVAILCPQELEEKITGHKHWMKERFGCVAALKSPAHITLIPPFWLLEEQETALQQVLQTFTSDIRQPEIYVNGFSHFNKRVLYAHVEKNPVIEKLKTEVENHFVVSFPGILKKDERPFHPHITIATRDLKPSDFIKAWEHFDKTVLTATVMVHTISLLKLSPGKWNVIGQKKW